MLPKDRRQSILAILSHRQRVNVNDLAVELGTSRETIRRDLSLLDSQHLLRKVHGGAIPVQTAQEDAFTRRARRLPDEKRRIGERAAALFSEGDSLFVDAGTTTLAFATALARASGLTVITNCVHVAGCLWRGPRRNRIHLLGGDYSGEAFETLGAETVRQAEQFFPDHAVLTVGAVDRRGGFMDFNLDEARVAAVMASNARVVTVLADHTKFAHPALARVCGLGRVSRLVTDAAPPPDLGEALAAGGTEILIA